MEFAHLQFKTALTRLPALIKPMVSRFHAGVACGQLYDFLGQGRTAYREKTLFAAWA